MKPSNNKNILEDLPRLKWACRRGMLELDVLLGNFLAEAYPSLSLEDKALFVELLEGQDPELFAWIMGHDEVTVPKFIPIVEMIRQHARSRI